MKHGTASIGGIPPDWLFIVSLQADRAKRTQPSADFASGDASGKTNHESCAQRKLPGIERSIDFFCARRDTPFVFLRRDRNRASIQTHVISFDNLRPASRLAARTTRRDHRWRTIGRRPPMALTPIFSAPFCACWFPPVPANAAIRAGRKVYCRWARLL
jgi:hypothetical protein